MSVTSFLTRCRRSPGIWRLTGAAYLVISHGAIRRRTASTSAADCFCPCGITPSSPRILCFQVFVKAFSSQDERTPGKEEEIGKDGAVWTVVGEEESRGRRQNQNALTDRQIQDAQTAFLCLVDAEMLIHIPDCSVAEARSILGDDSSSDMSVDELNAFLALV
ncbi:hypothetical protein CRENBAI_006307 [Crenichthys baileyi]|uniref:Uncharacterized protein n=1 Tax=Crenichthys baileyi TaxID=28760 RepID=A0AAV9S111_9TELE